jgi:alkylated DNA nucleotide flippase Atl1
MAQANINSRVYAYLVERASVGETTNYEQIALHFGLPSSGNQLGSTLTPILEDIFVFCESHRLPPLTAIVVRKSGTDAGLPGKGFWTLIANIQFGDNREFTKQEKEVLLGQFHADVFRMYTKLNK